MTKSITTATNTAAAQNTTASVAANAGTEMGGTVLTAAFKQWASRPADQRFASLDATRGLFELVLDARTEGAHETAAQDSRSRRRRTGYGEVYGVVASYDPSALSDAALALVALCRSTFNADDDLAPCVGVVLTVGPIESACRDDRERAVAKRWREAYGSHLDGAPLFEPLMSAARPRDIADCTEYLNRLCETPGLAVLPRVGAVPRLVNPAIPVRDVTRRAWDHLLSQR